MSDLIKNQKARIKDALSEGEIEGIVDSTGTVLTGINQLKGVALDGTPAINEGSSAQSFRELSFAFTPGTNAQTYLSGFPDDETIVPVNIEATNGSPANKQVADGAYESLRVTVLIPALYTRNQTDGRLDAATLSFGVFIKSQSAGIYKQVVGHGTYFNGGGDGTIKVKSLQPFTKSYRIPIPDSISGPWDIKVVKFSADVTDPEEGTNQVFFDAVTTINDQKLRHPNTAIAGIEFDAEQFRGGIPTRSYRIKGIKVQIPSNYNPVTRDYTGVWDGTFSTAWTDNPAWIVYDICTNTRYGLGSELPSTIVDKWSLYEIARYCDGVDGSGNFVGVDDGNGGVEPRFSCSIYIAGRVDALKLLRDLSGIFRGMVYWSSGQLTWTQDSPGTAVRVFNDGNVIDGLFDYASTDNQTRHTVAIAWYQDQSNQGELVPAVYEDQALIALYGYKELEFTAFGCKSQGQAYRAAKYAIITEQFEAEVISFSIENIGEDTRPGNLVEIRDSHRSTERMGGRILEVLLVSGMDYTIRLDGGPSVSNLDARTIKVELGDVIQDIDLVATATTTTDYIWNYTLPSGTMEVEAPMIWIMATGGNPTQTARVLSVSEESNATYRLVCLSHNASKFDAIELGLDIDVIQPGDLDSGHLVDTPSGIVLAATSSVETVAIHASWDDSTDVYFSHYEIELSEGGDTWKRFETSQDSTMSDIKVQNDGFYAIRVRSWNVFGKFSLWGESNNLEITSTVPVPTSLALASGTAQLIGKADGTVISRIKASWVNPQSSGIDVIVNGFELEIQKVSEATWSKFAIFVENPPVISDDRRTEYYFPEVVDGDDYKIRVRSRSILGRFSSWVESTAHTVIGKTAVPSGPSSLSASPLIGSASITWTQSTDLDRQETLIYITETNSAPAKATTTNRFEVLGNTLTIPNLTPGTTYYVFARTRDTSELISDDVAGSVTVVPASATAADALTASANGYLFATNGAGDILDVSLGDTDVELFLGIVGKTFNSTPTNDTFRFGTISAVGVTQNGGLTDPEVGITAMSGSSGYLLIPCIYRDGGGTDSSPITVKVVYSKAGASGTNALGVLPATFGAGQVGGFGSVLAVLNELENETGSNGDIHILAGSFTTPDNDTVAVSSTQIETPFGSTQLGRVYGMYSVAAISTRNSLTYSGSHSTNIAPIIYDGGWKFIDASGSVEAFTPLSTDVLLWAFEADTTSGGLNSQYQFYALAGIDGINSASVKVYIRAATPPTLPSATTTYTFATGVLTGLDNGWTQTIPTADGNPLYVTLATALSQNATDAIGSGEWVTPVISVNDGSNGTNGLNAATVFLYKRTSSATAPVVPSGTLTYTFATGILSGTLEGWTQSLPASGGAFRHITTAAAVSNSSTDNILTGEWATVSLLAEDGSQGDAGNDGLDSLDTLPSSFSPGQVGGNSSVELNLNKLKAGTADLGEVQIVGGQLKDTLGNTYSIVDAELNTQYGEGLAGRFFVMFSVADFKTRFGSLTFNTNVSTQLGVIIYEGGWKAIDNVGTKSTAFTPLSTDLIIAVVEAETTSSGLTRKHQYYSIYQARQFSVTGDPGSLSPGDDVTFASMVVEAGTYQVSANVSLGGGGSSSNTLEVQLEEVGSPDLDSDSDTGMSTTVAINYNDILVFASATTLRYRALLSAGGSYGAGGVGTIIATEIP